MTLRTIWLHLRVPFSFFLLPIYWFALSQSPAVDASKAIMVLLIVHLLLYPASNAYNSYFDKDEDSIGGLEKPPPVNAALHWVAWGLDILALLLGLFVGWTFIIYLLVYGTISKAYSNDRIRLKKYPVVSWLLTSFLQGGFTCIMIYLAVSDLPLSTLNQPKLLLAGFVCTLNLLALYPITQVYQHDEDSRRGDMTMSRLLGIRNTFVAATIIYCLAAVCFYVYFDGGRLFLLYLACLSPAILFFLRWFWLVCQDARQANYRMTMRMMWLAGICQNVFFLTLLFLTYS